MIISINQITPRRENGQITSIVVHFTARTEDGLINLTGNVPVDAELIDFEAIENEVRTELINRIMNGDLNAE